MTAGWNIAPLNFYISTHTLTWSVTISCGTQMKLNFISTHTLTWSVTKILTGKANPTIDFNSHAHVERDQIPQAHHETRFNFNSHAHVERDVYLFQVYSFNGISTHTLTWSVTFPSMKSTNRMPISTHTLTWSVTSSMRESLGRSMNFNSHAHVERD